MNVSRIDRAGATSSGPSGRANHARAPGRTTSPNNIATAPAVVESHTEAQYRYSALTDHTLTQLSVQHLVESADGHTASPKERVEANIAVPYQRYSRYEPIVVGDVPFGHGITSESVVYDGVADGYDMGSTSSVGEHIGVNGVDAISNSNTLSYNTAVSATTNSYLTSYSHDLTTGYSPSSSVHAEPEYEQYTQAHHNDHDNGYWAAQVEDKNQDLAGVGAQFDDETDGK